MVGAVDLTKVREARRKTRRRVTIVQHRPDGDLAPVSFVTARARRNVREAEAAVKKLTVMLQASKSGRINFVLVRQIRAAEKRLRGAREALSQIDPTS